MAIIPTAAQREQMLATFKRNGAWVFGVPIVAGRAKPDFKFHISWEDIGDRTVEEIVIPLLKPGESMADYRWTIGVRVGPHDDDDDDASLLDMVGGKENV
jgi:hypothetical protein